MTTTTAFIQKSPEAPTPPFTGYLAGVATIDSGETATLAIPCGGRSVVRIGIPTITSANLTFNVTPYDGATARLLKDKDGNTITVTAGTGGFVAEVPELSGAYSFTIISSVSQTPARAFDIQCVGTNPSPFEVAASGGTGLTFAELINPWNTATFVKPDVTAAGSSGAWVTGSSPITVATATGIVLVRAFGLVTTPLTSTGATGTIALGMAGDTGRLIGSATVNGTNLHTANQLWSALSPISNLGTFANSNTYALASTTPLILTIGTNSMTAGGMTITFQWVPVTAGATLVTATP